MNFRWFNNVTLYYTKVEDIFLILNLVLFGLTGGGGGGEYIK